MDIKNAPKKIYLNVGVDSDPDDSIDFKELHEVTWCEDRVDDSDIEYTRDNGWISVKTPPEEKPYRLEYVIIHKSNGVRMEAMYNTRVKRFFNRDFTELNHDVTHWQPLPQPPEGE
jgi:hypothetical protein